MTALHQFLASFVERDAVSAHVCHVQRITRSLGVRSEIYAGESRFDSVPSHFFRDYTKHASDSNGQYNSELSPTLLYHLSTGSPVATYLLDRPERKAVDYHNVTPTECMTAWEPLVGPELEQGRRQLSDLAPVSDMAFAVSEYNRAELVASGYQRTRTLPFLFDPGALDRDLDDKTASRLYRAKADGGADWLFVGRIAPHKAQHDLIKAFAVYRRVYDPKARLHLVGATSSHAYLSALRRFVDALQLRDAVCIVGSVSDGAVAAHYRTADVFVCLSDHEGFGVPLLEALHNQLPVVAYDSSAVGETLEDSAILLPNKTATGVAAAVQRVLYDDVLQKALADRGTRRLDDFALSRTEALWRDGLEDLLAISSRSDMEPTR